MTRKLFTAILLALTLLCACYGLYPRIMIESANRNIAIVSDYREITALAKNSGLDVDEAISILKRNGLTGLMVSELIGDSLMHGIGHAEIKTAGDNPGSTEGTIITVKPFSEHKVLLNEWLRLRFGITDGRRGAILLTMPSNMIRNSGVIPDIDGLESAPR